LLHLIEDILDISKIEAGKMKLHPQEIHLAEFLKSLENMIQVEANKKKINFVCEFAPNLPEAVCTDSKRLKQVLLNLLNNAIKFTQKGTVIFRVNIEEKIDLNGSVHTSKIPLHFLVEDSGIGIAPEKLESIFLAFEQTGETKFKVQGTGLGLAISQEIVKMMGSKIVVKSQKEVGSSFEFVIYVDVLEKQTTPQPQNLLFGRSTTTNQNLAQILPLNILLAEDNIVNQKVASKILGRLGYTIDIASNGLQAVEALENQIYDVVLMDVQMPEMDGIEATKCILKLTNRPHIIAITANAMESDRLICLASGMDDYITKPINIDLLVEALWRSPIGQRTLQEITVMDA
jgi:CheY-like chemotaxis protein